MYLIRYYLLPCLIQIAAKGGSKRIVKLALRYGMDINHLNHYHQSALHFAAGSVIEVQEKLLDYLVMHGSIVDARDVNGTTPLMEAACSNHVEAIYFLVRNGANVDARDHKGFSALHIATTHNHVPALEALIKCGADPSCRDRE